MPVDTDDDLDLDDVELPNGLEAGATKARFMTVDELRLLEEYRRDWQQRMATWLPIQREIMRSF